MSVHTNTTPVENQRAEEVAARLGVTAAQTEEAPTSGFGDCSKEKAAHAKDPHPARDGDELTTLETRTTVQHRRCCVWIRWFAKVASLVLSIALAVDLFLFCWDLYEYGTQESSDETHRDALLWFNFFVLALLECCAAVVFLMHDLLSGRLSFASAVSSDHENGEESRSASPVEAVSMSSRKPLKEFMRCALFVVTSTYTILLYIVYFSDSRFVLPHSKWHRRFLCLTFLRAFCLILFAATFVLC